MKELKTYSEKLGVSEVNLKKRYDDLYSAFGNKQKALKRLRGDLLREGGNLRSSAIAWSGFIFGDTGVMDFVKLMKRKAENLYNSGGPRRELAIKNYMVTRDGIPLDTRKQVDFVDNPNFRQPLTGHAYSKRVYGIAGLGREMIDPKFFQMNFNDDVVQLEISYQFYKNYLFRCTQGETDRNMYKINAKSVTKFVDIGEQLSYEQMSKLIENCGYKIWKVSDIEKAFAMNKDERYDDRTSQSYALLLKGTAADIDIAVNDQGNRRIDVNDEEMWSGSYACWLPEHIPLEFGKDSDIFIVGSITKGEFNEKEQYNINACGIFPLPGYFEK